MMPQHTPGKNPFAVPEALAGAIAAEWEGKKAFNMASMPLTALAFTAIDRVASDKESIVEVLLAYVDTDTLCYRASSAPELLARQKQEWDPLLAWAGAKFDALWQTTDGLMPLEQPQPLHRAIKKYLSGMDAMRLAGVSVLASLLSSLVLALAVTEKRIAAAEAFALSRLEETFQAEKWGEEESASQRAQRILEEIKPVARFLSLLETA